MRILRSPRWRRRLIITTIIVSIAGPLIWLGVRYSTPGNPGAPHGPEVAAPVQPKRAPFTPAKRRAVRKVLKEFISTAVVRHDVGRSWDIAAPGLRQGVTHREWSKGEIPVVPYPASNKGMGNWETVNYSYKNTIGLEVLLFPKPGSGYSVMTADAEVVKGRDGRWRVGYWMPLKFHGPPSVVKKTTGKAAAKAKKLKRRHDAKSARHATQAASATAEGPRTGGIWWALPLGLLSMAIVLPILIGVVVWYRNRRAERAYLRSAD